MLVRSSWRDPATLSRRDRGPAVREPPLPDSTPPSHCVALREALDTIRDRSVAAASLGLVIVSLASVAMSPSHLGAPEPGADGGRSLQGSRQPEQETRPPRHRSPGRVHKVATCPDRTAGARTRRGRPVGIACCESQGRPQRQAALSMSWWNWVARLIAQVVWAVATICSAAGLAR
jgi:hypothetical protein